jgi:tRNA-dihydrouridine synthase
VLRNPWILAQAADLMAGRPAREVSMEDRGRFLLAYIDLLIDERGGEAEGFRHGFAHPSLLALPPGEGGPTGDGSAWRDGGADLPARGRHRWVVNKLRALCSYYTKGFDGAVELRTSIMAAESVPALRDIVASFFFSAAEVNR